MIQDIELVKKALFDKVMAGYSPYYDYESAVDHNVDWLVLDKSEFDRIVKKAKEQRKL